MPNITPYKAFVYNEELRTSLVDLLSPPYDVISPAYQKALESRSPFHSVRLSLTENAEDPERYQKMKAKYDDWKNKKTLVQLPKPAFYLVEEKFVTEEGPKTRIGFVALLEVSPFDKKEVYPHEFTLSGPKKDRFELLKTMGAELSQVFFCYEDSDLIVEKIYSQKTTQEPLLNDQKSTDVQRRVWAITDSQEIEKVKNLIGSRSVLIADGHHRYETAINYSQAEPGEKTKWVQGYFTNLKTPGFGILPIHRLFSLPETFTDASFREKLKTIFTVEPFSAGLDQKALLNVKKSDELAFLIGMQDSKEPWILRRKKKHPFDAEIYSLQKEIFEQLLGWDLTKLAKGVITYEHTTVDFKNSLQSLPRGVGFFLPPTDISLVMDVVKTGERMPQKSTFFFPKIASGLLIYELGNP